MMKTSIINAMLCKFIYKVIIEAYRIFLKLFFLNFMEENINIIFIGLMGSGKTSIGKHLSKTLGKKFIDTDHAIEMKTGVNVATIFELEGEKGFRLREKNFLKELKSYQNLIIATGGGIILSQTNRKLLSNLGKIFYLKSNPRELALRLRGDKSRPLLQKVNMEETLCALFEERDPIYNDIADHIIETKKKRLSDVSKEILEILK